MMLKRLIFKDIKVLTSLNSVKIIYLVIHFLFAAIALSMYYLYKSSPNLSMLAYYSLVLPAIIINSIIIYLPAYEFYREHLNGGFEYLMSMGVNFKEFILSKSIVIMLYIIFPLIYLVIALYLSKILNWTSLIFYIMTLIIWSFATSFSYIVSLNIVMDPSKYINNTSTFNLFALLILMYLPKLIKVVFRFELICFIIFILSLLILIIAERKRRIADVSIIIISR